MHVLYEKKNDLTLPKYLIVKRKGESRNGEKEREKAREYVFG